jgi:predicted  nucleic acid-binding Zn-ribbon protein
MAQGNSKLFAITTALFVVLAIIFFTLSITTIGKFTAQKKRVHHMEQQMLAGKSEIMKVPEMIGKLRVADKTNKELESQVADLTESSEEMTSELNELQKELTTVTIAKLVLETDRAGYTKNLIEARQAVRELREHGSTDYSIDEIEETLIEPSHEATPEAIHEPAESKESIPSENVWE